MGRQPIVTQQRGKELSQISAQRIAAEHASRDEEIDRQEAGRGRSQAAAQRRQLIDSEDAQDNAFGNASELRGRAARVQAARDAAVQANQARQQKAQIRGWLTKYAAQSHGSSHLPNDPIDSQQLAQLAQHDSVLASQLQAYKAPDAREQAATRAMGKFPSPYSAPSTPGAVAPASDALASPPTTSLISIPSEGPGIADHTYPATSGADEYMLGAGASSSGTAPRSDY